MGAGQCVVVPSADDAAKWDDLLLQVRRRLAQGIFPSELSGKLEALR